MSTTSQGRTVMVQGRIVWTSGDLFNGQLKTEFGTNKPKLNDQGEQMKEYGFGLAVSKDVLQQGAEGQPGHIWTVMHEEAYSLYPSGQLPPGFAMKYKDGDGVDHNGVPFSQRTGHAGHLVFTLTTQIPIKFFKWENGQNILINEGIKCGDYVNVQVQIKAHGPIGQGKPGLYLNPMAVQLIGYGEEIVNAPSGDQIFGVDKPPVPSSASAVPVAPQGNTPLMPQAAPQPQQPAPMPQAAPQPQQAAPMPQAGQAAPAPAPHYGVLPQAHQPQAAPQPQQAAPMPQAGQAAPAPAPMPGPPPLNTNEQIPF